MRLKPWLILTALVALSSGVFWFFSKTAFDSGQAVAPAAREAEPQKIDRPLVTFIDPTKGPASAPHLIVIFGDYACAFCREAAKTVEQVATERPGEIRYVWKSLPNPSQPNSDVAAEAALCAKEQGKFWEYHAELIAEPILYNHTSLTLIANEIGLDLQKFGHCLTNRVTKPLVDRTVSEAIALEIDATPYLFVNGKRHAGQLTYDQLVEALAP